MSDTPDTPRPFEGFEQFDLVPVRPRLDGWTPDRQTNFIESLAESGCVREACARVGMSVSQAYALRRRPDAQGFRLAWEAALDFAIKRLSDAAFSRAINGVVQPVFYQGEQVGERRRYDERLTMFLLRARDPVRYGPWRDKEPVEQHSDGPALLLNRLINAAADQAYERLLDEEEAERPRRRRKRPAEPESDAT